MNNTEAQFDQVAVEYDFVTDLTGDFSFFIANMPSEKNKTLDIGCGSGILAEKLSHHFQQVIGIDLSKGMLELARQKHQRKNILYLNQDAEQLHLETKFDYIVSRTTFHHIKNLSIVLEQIKEHLNEGGRLVIVDNVSEVPTPPRYAYTLGASLEFVPNCFKYGFKNAARIHRYNTSKPWLEHLAIDKYLSERQYHSLYEHLLPNCSFHKMGWAMGIVWQK